MIDIDDTQTDGSTTLSTTPPPSEKGLPLGLIVAGAIATVGAIGLVVAKKREPSAEAERLEG